MDPTSAGRARVSDKAWIAMGAGLSDEEYNRRMAEYFGIELRWPVNGVEKWVAE